MADDSAVDVQPQSRCVGDGLPKSSSGVIDSSKHGQVPPAPSRRQGHTQSGHHCSLRQRVSQSMHS